MQKIQDYAAIGNGKSVALISREGSLDWLCWPRFDSPSLFAGILDQERGGVWKIAPTQSFQVTRKYVDSTNVLQTHFSTRSGSFSLTDFMPAFSEKEKQQFLQPEQEIIRRVECEQGEVEIHIAFSPRPDYGRGFFDIKDCGKLGLRIEIGRQLVTLRSDLKLNVRGNSASTTLKLKAGQWYDFSLSYAAEAPATLPPLGNCVFDKLYETVRWWQNWANKTTYQGPYKEQVIRSALALKLLGYAPSGAFVAASTTSLPQHVGADLNWDYRFCWLRDAAFTAKALFGLGYIDEGEAFVSWLLHSTRLTFPKLSVLYDVYGEKIDNDAELSHLKGYAGSSPVRIGNGVRAFFELDVYGEVIEAVTHLVQKGKSLDRTTQKMLLGFGNYVCKHWQHPDTGIWEKIDPLRHYTHSKLMCWVALDRLIELHKQGQLKTIPDAFLEQHYLIRKEIEENGWNRKIQSYTQVIGGEDVDATSLTMPLYGFDDFASFRMQKTLQRVKEKLSPGPGLIYRYEMSPQEGEGAFGLCSFWYVEFLARTKGRLEEAQETFKHTLSYANDLGLFSEEIDPKTGDALGNFPQAFTHIGLINAALALEEKK